MKKATPAARPAALMIGFHVFHGPLALRSAARRRRGRSSGHRHGVLIQDVDRPGAGFIKVNHQPMDNAAAAVAAFPDWSRAMEQTGPLTDKRLRNATGRRCRWHPVLGP